MRRAKRPDCRSGESDERDGPPEPRPRTGRSGTGARRLPTAAGSTWSGCASPGTAALSPSSSEERRSPADTWRVVQRQRVLRARRRLLHLRLREVREDRRGDLQFRRRRRTITGMALRSVPPGGPTVVTVSMERNTSADNKAAPVHRGGVRRQVTMAAISAEMEKGAAVPTPRNAAPITRHTPMACQVLSKPHLEVEPETSSSTGVRP